MLTNAGFCSAICHVKYACMFLMTGKAHFGHLKKSLYIPSCFFNTFLQYQEQNAYAVNFAIWKLYCQYFLLYE
jgi:hypothetical protein